MAHDSNHGHSTENKTIISFKSSFWLIIILVGLFVAALNFIKAESGGEGEAKHEGKEMVEGEHAKSEKATEAKHAEPAAHEEHAADTAHKTAH